MPQKYLILHRNQEAAAQQVYEHLRDAFGVGRVQLGFDIPFGADLNAFIRGEIVRCRAIVVLIDAYFVQTVSYPTDPIRLTLEHALPRAMFITTIPFLVDGTRLPTANELPSSLVKLASRQPATMSDLESLVTMLKAKKTPPFTGRWSMVQVVLTMLIVIVVSVLLLLFFSDHQFSKALPHKPTSTMSKTAFAYQSTPSELELTATFIVQRATEEARITRTPSPTPIIIEEVRPMVFQSLTSVVFDSKREHVLCGFSKGIVIIGIVPDSTEVARYEQHQLMVNAVAYGPDERTFASASNDGTVTVWEVETGTTLQTFTGHEAGGVYTVVFHPDGKRVLSGGRDSYVRVWDIETGEETANFDLHLDTVLRLAISHDGQTVTSTGLDGQVYIWDIETGEVQSTFSYDVGVYGLVYNDAGSMLAVGLWDGMVDVWDVETEQVIFRSEAYSPSRGPAEALAFSSNDRLLVQNTYDGAIVHSLETGNKVELRRRPESSIIGTVYGLAFASDNRVVYLASTNGIREFHLPEALIFGEKRPLRFG